MDEAMQGHESAEGLLLEGQRLLNLRQSALAADKLLRVVRSVPPHGPLYETACARLSLAYKLQGKPKKAISMLRQAIKQAPRNAVYRLHLAELYREVNNQKRALTEARRALKLLPDLLEARELVAELLLEQGFVDSSIREATLILKRSPRNLRGLDLLGTAFLYQGDVDHALQVVNQMALLSPSDPLHHFKRAILLQQKGQVGEALGAFMRVLEMGGEEELVEQAADAIQMLDEFQVRQILLLASEDAIFRNRLSHDVERATRQRGYHLSPGGLMALSQINFDRAILSDSPATYLLPN